MADNNSDYFSFDGNSLQANGSVAQKLLQAKFDVNVLRPWQDDQGRSFITTNSQKFQANASTLRKDEWKRLDEVVVKVAPKRRVGTADLIARGLTYSIGGMGKTVLETEVQSDAMEAQLSMDGATRGKRDRPQYNIGYLPLPITHSDFQISARQLEASRNGNTPLDTTSAELATRRVVEKIETMLFQGASSYAFGGGTIFGYKDYTYRNSVSIGANWDDSAASAATILANVIAMKQAAFDDRYYGPYILYVPPNFELVLDEDYSTSYADVTIRDRLMKLSGIEAIRTCDFISNDEVFLVQMTPDVIRLVEGLGITVLEWESEGGMLINYKVMAIQVPQIRSDYDNRCGIQHLT